jgi:hypothetical protein
MGTDIDDSGAQRAARASVISVLFVEQIGEIKLLYIYIYI